MNSQGSLMLHAGLGIVGILLAVALFMDVLNVSSKNVGRIKSLSLLVAIFVVLSYVIGGYWYVTKFIQDRAIILKGPWPWGHTFFMEVKEHAFFLLLLLSIYLPISVHKNVPLADKDSRKLVLGITLMVIVLGLVMEGAGAIISKAVTVGLMGRA